MLAEFGKPTTLPKPAPKLTKAKPSGQPYDHALDMWTVEKRPNGWCFSKSFTTLGFMLRSRGDPTAWLGMSAAA